MTNNFRALLAEAKLPEDTVQVCLRGDLAADHHAAEAELKQAQQNRGDGLETPGVAPLIERIEALEAQMRESTYSFRLRALSRTAFRALVAAHPPRRGDDGEPDQADSQIGFNRDTFFPALLQATTVDPDLSDDEWQDLLEKLTDRQYGDLTDAAWFLNRGEVDVPFSRVASLAKRTTGDE